MTATALSTNHTTTGDHIAFPESDLNLPKRVLLVTSVRPSYRYTGTSNRAAATLQLLSKWVPDVHLLVIPIYSDSQVPDPDTVACCKSWHVATNPGANSDFQPQGTEWSRILTYSALDVPRECIDYNSEWQNKVTKIIETVNPDLVIIYRFWLAQFVLSGVNTNVPVWIDIDELDSNSKARLGNLYGLVGAQQEKCLMSMEAHAYRVLEKRYLSRFQRIFTSSDKEAEAVLSICPQAKVLVMPNTYPSISPQPIREPDGTAQLLYVGTFGYYPNCDAVSYFCTDVLPQIQDNCRLPINVSIVGTGSDQLGEDSCWTGVSFVGAVPDLAPWYANCDLVIVPLRSGAGTRIKILEAFSHQRAVVSTTIGAEGLKVTPGTHLGIADSAEAFAEQCLTLIDQPDKRNALAFNGHQFFVENHTQSRLENLMSQLFQ